VNGDAVGAILDAVDMKVQLGGGVRDLQTVEDWLSRGVSRVILGTAAVRNPTLVQEACRLFPGQVAVGIDSRDGKVAVEGWSDVTDVTALELAQRFENHGVAAIIYTDIARDGAMQGPNLGATIALARAISIPVIASGGVASMVDLMALKAAGEGIVEGVISGRAIYDRRIDPSEAVALLAGAAD
jgi:phosphoribosylformimino-5-aminoimidazole carboxamide ribotide isomerase